MVKRVFLDEECVEAAVVPAQGESWISDTKVKGFGLRLINTKSGPSKKFCIRTVNKEGRSIRKNFDEWEVRHEHNLDWKIENLFSKENAGFGWQQPLGRYAERARAWAINEIRVFKGLDTIETQDQKRSTEFKAKLNDVTLLRCVNAVLANYRRMNMSMAYVDKLDKLFSTLIPPILKNKLMREISREDARQIHRLLNASPGNRQTMLPFLGRVFTIYKSLAGGRDEFAIAKDYLRRQSTAPTNQFHIDDSNIEKVKRVVALLEGEDKLWQQAKCLRLFLSSHCPLSQLMAARWDQIYEVTFKRSDVTRLEWRYSNKRRGYEQFSKADEKLVLDVFEKRELEFAESPYCFPSKHGRKVGHIRSVDQIWTKVLHLSELQYVTPKKLRSAINDSGAWRVFDEDPIFRLRHRSLPDSF